MSRFVKAADMTRIELFRCYSEATAVLNLCHRAACELEDARERIEIDEIAENIQQATRLVMELLEPLAQALETHEGVAGTS